MDMTSPCPAERATYITVDAEPADCFNVVLALCAYFDAIPVLPRWLIQLIDTSEWAELGYSPAPTLGTTIGYLHANDHRITIRFERTP